MQNKPRIMFYHDGRHPLIYMYEPPISREQYETAVDELVGTPVEAIMFCVGDGRTVLYDTKVGELWGHNVDKWPELIYRRAHLNAKQLIGEDNDPLRIICERAHAEGLLLYPTLLVQQPTGKQGYDVRGSDFRYIHPELEIGAENDLPADYPGLHCADFKHTEIRDERLALIKEILKNYPVDGFELNMNYVPYYFHPERIDQGRKIMTEWIGEVYRAVKAGSQDREFVVRVPVSVEKCHSIGLDLQEWAKRGIVDVLVGEDIGGSQELDPMQDFRSLVKLARGTNCRVHAAICLTVDSDRMADASIEMVRGAACNYWSQGIDGLYLAYWFAEWPYNAGFYEKLREVAFPRVMGPGDKSYYVLTETARVMRPVSQETHVKTLPAALNEGVPVTVDFTIADDIAYWDASGRVHEVLLRLRITDVAECDAISIKLNGAGLPQSMLRMIDENYRLASPRFRIPHAYWFVYRLERDYWPRQGLNSVEVCLSSRTLDVDIPLDLRDLELDIKYLRGRNAYRGYIDQDLGPYQAKVHWTPRGWLRP